MKILAGLKVPLIVHAEVESSNAAEDHGGTNADRSYGHYLQSRPPSWEVTAIRKLIRLIEETGCAVHIVHLSTADALDDINKARKENLPLTVETCPHYLTFEAEGIRDGETFFKCAPPIREKENRDRLWKALLSGNIDMVVSDHSPCTPHLKRLDTGDFVHAWGGIAGIQFSLPAVWSGMEAKAKASDLSQNLLKLSTWMSRNPARVAGLPAKGSLEAGKDADIIFFDPSKEFQLRAEQILFRHKVSPYIGRHLKGEVSRTFVRGRVVWDGRIQAKNLGMRLYRKNGEKSGSR